jgi:hypothetical protein
MGFRLQLPPVVAAATGAMLLTGLIAAPAIGGQAEATAGSRRHGHQLRSHASSWKQWHREPDHHWDRSRGRRRHAGDRRSLASCVKAAKVWSDRDRADRQRQAERCRRPRPRQPVRATLASLRPTRLAQPTIPRRPAVTSADDDEDEPADSIDGEPEPGSSSPTTVCEPTTTTTRPPTTSGTTTSTSTTTSSSTTTTTTTTTTEPPTTSETTTTSTITTTRALTTPTRSAGEQPPGYVPQRAGPSGTGAEPTTTTTPRPPGHGFQPAGTTTTSQPAGATGTSQPAGTAGSPTSTVCEPTGGGQLPATGSSAIPLFVAVVALFAGGLSVLLATRIRPVD